MLFQKTGFMTSPSPFSFINIAEYQSTEKELHLDFKIGRDKARKERYQARLRGEIHPWTRECLPKLYHNTQEGKREAYKNSSLLPASVVPPDIHDPRAEEHYRRLRREYVLNGLEKTYPLLENVHDRRIFKIRDLIESFMHITVKYMTPEQLEE
jgi:hypothetical protein